MQVQWLVVSLSAVSLPLLNSLVHICVLRCIDSELPVLLGETTNRK